MITLEICCYGADGAMDAQAAGADRIELCSAPKEGGLTPSIGTLKVVSDNVTIPVHPIVRPRAGDFCYSKQEIKTILSDISFIRDLGFPGIVVGILDEDGDINCAQMQNVIHAAGNMSVTFHRAFDVCRDPKVALKQLTDLGVIRILTSGQQQSAEKGLPLIKELNALAKNITIMAGAGVRLNNLSQFLDAGIREIHSSARTISPSRMRYRKTDVSMASDSQNDEFNLDIVDIDAIKAMKKLINSYLS